MYPVSDTFLSSVRQAHKLAVVVERTTALDGQWTEVVHQVNSGSVKLDRKADARRTLSMKLVGYIQDVLPEVSPYNTLLRVKRGITYGTGQTEWVPLGVFRAYDVEQNGNEVDVTGYSLEIDLRDRRFISPWFIGITSGVIGPNPNVSDEMELIIHDAIPEATLRYLGGDNLTIQWGTVFERDRLKALQEIAKAVGCTFYSDYLGRFVVEPPSTLADTSVFDVNAGGDGVLISYSRKVTRDKVYNGVVVTNGATGVPNSPIIRRLVVDNDPTSPTYWGGSFGKVPRFYSSPFFQTSAQADAAGESILATAKGINASVSFDAVPNPALDIDDVITVQYRDGTTQKHIIDTLEIGLTASDPMSGTTRADRFDDLEET